MTAQVPLLGWEVVQLDPPRRPSRHFKHDGRMRAVNPDAFGVLRRDDVTWPIFLEWERRVVRPSTMSQRLAPYLRWYSSHRPTDDHGARPAVLVVFDDEIAQTHFLRVAREEMRAEGATVPLWVSHRQAVDALGPLGRAWRANSASGSRPRPCHPGKRRLKRWEREPSGPCHVHPLQENEKHAFARRQRSEGTPEAGRTVVRLDAAALWRRLAILNRSQNWLAKEVGISPGYLSTLVNGRRAASGGIRCRMQKALGMDDFHELFNTEERNDIH